MARRNRELAKTIDHTLPGTHPLPEEVERVCAEAAEHHFASVCVAPEAVSLAAERLRGLDVKVAAVVPRRARGAALTTVAVAERCVAEGAHEIDVTLDTAAMLSGEFALARDELAAVVRAVRLRSVTGGRGSALVKVVLECGQLGPKRTDLACWIVEDVEADFVSAAVGARSSSTALDEIELLRERLPERVGVKATGAIASAGEAEDILVAGAARIGTRHAVEFVHETGIPA